jgi:hypothetical protein
MRRTLLGLCSISAIALLAIGATPATQYEPDHGLITLAPSAPSGHGLQPLDPAFNAITVAPQITAQWDLHIAAAEPFTMCLKGAVANDTLSVQVDPVSKCTDGSARSSYRPTCVPTDHDEGSFNASSERFRFVICAPGKAFLMILPRGPATVPPGRRAT